MHHTLAKLVFALSILALTAAVVPLSQAQGLVSSGISGSLVDNAGKPLGNVTVNVVHVPTNTTYTATTSPAGRFRLSGLRVGGPYTISASVEGYEIQTVEGLQVNLSQDAEVQLLARSDVVELDALVISEDTNSLDASTTGAGSVLNNQRIATMPTVNRSFADMMKTNPFAAIRSGSQVTALGMNYKFNSISIDGARQNDNFGLTNSGLFSLKNPFSLDALENFSIDLTPYDVTQSGFAGASINAVSKSGTNEFHGSAYYYYTSYKWQGADVFGTTAGQRTSTFHERTWGATLGGPIIKDKLFFFINYEKFSNPSGGASDPGFQPNPDVLTSITGQFAGLPGSPAFGSFGGGGGALLEDEKRLIKLDWNITRDHRLTARYSVTEGNQPSYPDYNSIGAPSSFPSLSPSASFANGVTTFDSKHYALAVKEEVWASQLFSNWTTNLKTEFAFSKNDTTSLRSTPVNLPEVVLLNVPGTSVATGAPVTTNTAVLFGTDYSSMGNGIIADTIGYSGNATYTLGNWTFKGGFDREQSDFENLFRNGSYGRFVYNYAPGFDLANAAPRAFVRNVATEGFPPTDVSSFEQTGLFGQAKWEPTQRFNVTLGLRFDRLGSPIAPTYNPAIENAFGLRNDLTIDGAEQFSPRLSFNYSVNESRSIQVRGGAGLFLGRSPWVWLSNSYGNAGMGRFTRTLTTGTLPTLNQYLGGTFTDPDPIYAFNPESPLGTTNATTGGGNVAFIRDGLKLPTNLRGNLAVDVRIPKLDAVFSVEYIHTDVQEAFYYQNINLVEGGRGADERIYFRRFASASNPTPVALGTPGGTSYTRSTAFNVASVLGNTSIGKSDYVAISLDRPFKNSWAYNLTYTRGRATEAQPAGSSTATSNIQYNVVFNQNTPEETRSDYEVRDRLQATLSREFNFLKRYKTTASLYYEGRSGLPYSYVYSGDLNHDSYSQNDALAVPTGVDDSRFDFSGMSTAQRDAYINFMQTSELAKYAGGHAPRNAFLGPWQNRLDLHFSQEVKVAGPVRVEVFADFINFGSWLSKDLFNYVETLGSPDNSNQIVVVGNASYNAQGRIRPIAALNPDGSLVLPTASQFLVNNNVSRWRVQAGARIRF